MSTSPKEAETKKCSLLVVVKGEHKYLVKYNPARKAELFDLLLSWGMEDDFNLTSFDALALIERLKNQETESSVISLSEHETAVESDLSIDSPDAREGETGFHPEL